VNLAERNKCIAELFRDALDLLVEKGKDYSPSGGAFENFEATAQETGLSREQVLLVYLSKHMVTLRKVANGGASVTEPVRGRALDVINYVALLVMMLSEREAPRADGALPPAPAAEVRPYARRPRRTKQQMAEARAAESPKPMSNGAPSKPPPASSGPLTHDAISYPGRPGLRARCGEFDPENDFLNRQQEGAPATLMVTCPRCKALPAYMALANAIEAGLEPGSAQR